ncbi:MAG: YMGG-like glycine zipper-containing protein [Xanthomonadales bacterium]|nr:YMGG-like glycine zipper-containing protein [Xanthomonadales bacterium]
MHTDPNSGTLQIANSSTTRAMALTALLALFTSGCAMNETQSRTGTGAAIGAIGGALLGTSRESAAIGAAVGAAGGYMYDQHSKNTDAQTENEQLRQENERLKLEAENKKLKEEAQQ